MESSRWSWSSDYITDSRTGSADVQSAENHRQTPRLLCRCRHWWQGLTGIHWTLSLLHCLLHYYILLWSSAYFHLFALWTFCDFRTVIKCDRMHINCILFCLTKSGLFSEMAFFQTKPVSLNLPYFMPLSSDALQLSCVIVIISFRRWLCDSQHISICLQIRYLKPQELVDQSFHVCWPLV